MVKDPIIPFNTLTKEQQNKILEYLDNLIKYKTDTLTTLVHSGRMAAIYEIFGNCIENLF